MTDPFSRWRRNLSLLVVGNAVSSFGNAVYLVAMILFLKEITQSPMVLGAFQFLALLPGFILSPISGTLIDRWDRRRILIYTDAIRGVVMLGAAALLLGPWSRSVVPVLILSAIAGLGHAFFVPAAQAIIPQIVPPASLNHANGLRAGGSQIFNMTGSAVGGLLFALVGAPIVLVLNGVTFLLSAIQESAIRLPDRESDRRRGVTDTGLVENARRAFRYLLSDGIVRRGVLSQAGMFLLSPVFLLSLPFILLDQIGVEDRVLGFVFAISLAGGISVFVVLGRRTADTIAALPITALAYAGFGLVFAAVAIVQTLWMIAIGAFLAGAAAAGVYLSVTVRIQHDTPGELHGRLFAFMEALSAGIAPVAYLVTGWTLERLGPTNYAPLFYGAAALALMWSLYLFMKRAPRAAAVQ